MPSDGSGEREIRIANDEKVLIVGGCGYIGGFLTDHLSEHDYDVTVYDNLLFESRFMKPCKFIYGDIRDEKKMSTFINNYDVVVWLAGLVGDGACAVNPELTKKLNVDSNIDLNGKIILKD